MRRSVLLGVAVALLPACSGEDEGEADATPPSADASACGQQTSGGPFAFPLLGTAGEDVFYTVYADQDPDPGAVLDFACGAQTYDGHRGTDIALLDYASMDRGIEIIAAADGTVVDMHDGEFDRNTEWVVDGPGNFVTIEHENNVVTLYAHMVRDSVAVSLGEDVTRGQVLGRVGSSGRSDHPHLHFEVIPVPAWESPFSGACNCVATWWDSQPEYDDEFRLINSGLTNVELDFTGVREPPDHIDVFTTSTPVVFMWVEVLDVPVGTVSSFNLIDPDGNLYGSVPLAHDDVLPLSWWWAWFPIPGGLTQPGTWQFRFLNDGELIAEHEFLLAGSVAEPAPPGIRRQAGATGGGLRRP